jgi:hypothetical protein
MVEGEMMFPITEQEKARWERQDDLRDAHRFGLISREQFLKMMYELNFDYYEARWEADQIRPDAAE